ncbi:MAG: DHHA1 domain-containing protein [bacterium]
MTERLYFDDPYRIDFVATVVGRVEVDGRPGLILDQTCFYPRAGGQGCDRGFLNDVPVIDVLEREGEILHLMGDEITADSVGGRIDWKRRFDFMQQHSGQHVLSQSFLRVLGADTVSAHLGEETSTIEIAREDLTIEEAHSVEQFANGVLFENRPIKTYFVSEDEISKIPLRKVPPQKGNFRIVEVEAFDHSACGGTHCHCTGEIGLIKVGRWERIRKNIRLQFLCGGRALSDYRWKSQVVEELAERYSARGSDVIALVTKQAEENKELRRNLRSLSERAMEFEAHELLSKAVVLGEIRVVKAVFDRRPFEEIKSLASKIVDCEKALVLFGNRGEKGQLLFSCSEGLPYKMNDLIGDACARLGGRGGGSPRLAFGGGPGTEKVEEAVMSVCEHILKGQG